MKVLVHAELGGGVSEWKGISGIDGMGVGEFVERYTRNGGSLRHSLLSGNYLPQGIKFIEITEPNGGLCKLCIPTIIDRVIQQAIAQHRLFVN